MTVERLSSGEWVTKPFLLTAGFGSLILSIVGISYLAATATGTVDALGRPLGTDFSSFWTAGRLVWDGRAADAYNWDLHYEAQKLAHDRVDVPFFTWAYPPPFLLFAAATALLPYLAALFFWQAATFIPAVWVTYRIVPDRLTNLLAAGCPAVLLCMVHGQNSFLTAVL